MKAPLGSGLSEWQMISAEKWAAHVKNLASASMCANKAVTAALKTFLRDK
jgi:hypothetical protein